MGLAEGIALLIVAAAIGLLDCNADTTLAFVAHVLIDMQVPLLLVNAVYRAKGLRQRG